jgi:hypothetical protein
MPYQPDLDIVQILRSTLYLLEHSHYPEKPSVTVEALRLHLTEAIAKLEAAKIPPGREDAAEDKEELA